MKLKNVADLYPLSPLQQGILFHTLYTSHAGMYTEQFGTTFCAPLDVAAFKGAWQHVVERHTILRTAFLWDGLEEPLQVVRQRVAIPWEEQDWQGLTSTEQARRIQVFRRADRLRDFELDQAPLMRLALLQLAPDYYHFVWTHHHLLLDGWSMAVLLEEVSACYTALRQGRAPTLPHPRPYRDYITWLQAQSLAAAEAFWRCYLAGFTSPTPLIVDASVAEEQRLAPEDDCEEQELRLSRETTEALQAFVRRHQLTLSSLMQGAWALLLSWYSGETDVVFGTTVSTRPAVLPGVETMIGLFINTLPTRVRVFPEARLLPWLRQVQVEQAEARQYDYTPLVQIQGWSETPRGQPLFESLLVVENYPVGSAADQREASLPPGETSWGVVQTNYPLMLTAVTGQELLLRANYSRRRFGKETIARLLGHLRTLLEGMLAHSEQPLRMLPKLTEAECRQLLVEWNATQAQHRREYCIHELFEAQVKRTPDAVALVWEQEQITYQELNARANQLARHLLLTGVALETPVGICLEHGIESIVAVLGILKVGGAYVPLDAASPPERLALLLQCARVPLVLTQTHLLERLPAQTITCYTVECDWRQAGQQANENVERNIHPANAAYVLYTSGSTGAPKGVVVEHRQVASYVAALGERIAFASQASFAMVQPLTVDSCLTMLFPALLTGGVLQLIPRERALDPQALAESFARAPADYLKITPSHLAALLGGVAPQRLLPRLGLILGGEASQRAWVQQLRRHLSAGALYNHYGPTETTVGSLVFQEEAEAQARPSTLTPIGRPLSNTRVYVLDSQLQVVPIGVLGELYIAGAGLARGYLGHPELTAERFLPDPFSIEPGQRLYKTGDLVRYRPDGNVEFVRRNDEQVKIRGYRIEPGEIEAVLRQHPAVQQAMVVVQQEPGGETYQVPPTAALVAYVVPAQGLQAGQALSAALRAHVNERLPTYMHPSRFVLLDAFPLTAQGKVDRRALAATGIEARPEEEVCFIAPRNALEETLAQIWSDVLHLKQFSVHDNFFDLGGHSLSATQVISRVREHFQVKLPLRSIFAVPTISGLAEAIIQQTIEEADSDIIAQILAQKE